MTRYLILFATSILFLYSCGPSSQQKDHAAYHNPAIQPFTDSIEAEPANATYYFLRAEALSNMSLDSLALEDVQQALKLDKDNPQYLFTTGYLLLRLDRPQDAVKALQRNLEQSPGNANVRLLLARAYLAAQNPPAAQQQVDKILAAAPQHIPAQIIRAQIMIAHKDTAGAILAMKTILAADPVNYDASFQLADWYKAAGNPEAVVQYTKTFRLDTTNADPLFDIGEFYEQQQQPAKAKAAYRTCIITDMDYTDAYLRTGDILLREDSVEKALRHFNLAIATMPNSAEGYYNKGLCHEKLKQKDSATTAFRQALVFDKDMKKAAEGLQRLKH